MIDLPPRWTLDELRSADLGRAGVWASPRFAMRERTALPWNRCSLTERRDSPGSTRSS